MRKYIFLGLGLLALSAPLVAGAVTITSPMASNNLEDALNMIINVCLRLVLPLATIIILVAAFFIVKAGGDSTKLDKGKKMLIAGLGGLAIVILGAGSGALLKNIFKISDIPSTFTNKVSVSAPIIDGIALSNMKDVEDNRFNLEVEILALQNQLDDAQKNGDKAKVEELTKQISLKKNELDSVIAYGEQLKRIAQKNDPTFIADIYQETYGKIYLAKYGTKDENGFYKMEGNAKYNPDTGEFIDASGNIFTNTTINAAGRVFCNCK